MPIYEYTCNNCNETFSVLKLTTREEETTCPSCGSKEVTKKMSAFSCCTPTGTGSSFTGGT